MFIVNMFGYKSCIYYALLHKAPCVRGTVRKFSSVALCNEQELDAAEKNIIMRHHENNIPRIRQLLKETNISKNKDIQKQLQFELEKLPNATHHRLVGFGNDPRELFQHNSKEVSKAKEFSEACKYLNYLRMDNLRHYTGHKSYYLMGPLANLEQALVEYALNSLKAKSFELVSVPDILPSSVIEGCGMQTSGDRTQVYRTDSNLCLSGTSEMALAGLFSQQVFNAESLPIRVAAVSRCYRAETSGLTEEKGIYRVHQFTKVEMFAVCSDTHSETVLDEFRNLQVALYKNLDLTFRVLDMPPTELGASAYQKYDIEAWLPGRKMWGEISSCSDCTDYQAKRLNIRYTTNTGNLKFAHTVNGTAAAIPRLLIAVIETNQIENEHIALPKVLQPLVNCKLLTKNTQFPQTKLIKFLKT